MLKREVTVMIVRAVNFKLIVAAGRKPFHFYINTLLKFIKHSI